MGCKIMKTKTIELVFMDNTNQGYIIIHDRRGEKSINRIMREYPNVQFIILYDPPISRLNEKMLKLVRSICSESQF